MKSQTQQPSSAAGSTGAARPVRWYRSISVKLAVVLGLAVLSVQLLSSALIIESLRSSQSDSDIGARAAAAPYAEYLSNHLQKDDQGRWLPTPDAQAVVESFLDFSESYVWLDNDSRVLVVGPRLSNYAQVGDVWTLCSSPDYCPLELGKDGQRRAGSNWTRLALEGEPIGTFVLIWFEDPDLQARQQRQFKLDLYSRIIAAALLLSLIHI